jgi:hypothetical protein
MASFASDTRSPAAARPVADSSTGVGPTIVREHRRGRGALAALGASAFWASGIALLVGACASAALLALALVPVLAFGYLVFSLIALTGDRDVD